MMIFISTLILVSLLRSTEGKARSKENETLPVLSAEKCMEMRKFFPSHPFMESISYGMFPRYNFVSIQNEDPCYVIFKPFQWSGDAQRVDFMQLDYSLQDKIASGRTTCRPHCILSLNVFQKPLCGPRRDPVYYSATPFQTEEQEERIGCTNLNLPFASPHIPIEINAYVYTVFPVDQRGLDNDLSGLWTALRALNVESMHLVRPEGNMEFTSALVAAAGKDLKRFAARMYAANADAVFELLRAETELEAVNLEVRTKGMTSLPAFTDNVAKLKILVIRLVEIAEYPDWWAEATGMEALSVMECVFIQRPNFQQVAANMPNLDYLNIRSSMIGDIREPFLPASTRMSYLTLFCAQISYIAPGAFDHMTQLEYLELGGNFLATLDPAATATLPLLYFSVVIPAIPMTKDYRLPTLFTSLNLKKEGVSTIVKCHVAPEQKDRFVEIRRSLAIGPEHLVAAKTTLKGLNLGGLTTQPEPSLFQDLKALKYLSLGDAQLTTLHFLNDIPLCNLRMLKIDGNNLSGSDWFPSSLRSPKLTWMSMEGANISEPTPAFIKTVSSHQKLRASALLFMGETSEGNDRNPLYSNECKRYVWEHEMYGLDRAAREDFLKANPACAGSFAALDKYKPASDKTVFCPGSGGGAPTATFALFFIALQIIC